MKVTPFDAPGGSSACDEVADLGLERELERVLGDRRLVASRWRAVDRPARPARLSAVADALAIRTASAPTRSASVEVQRVRGGEAPRAVDQDPDAEALRLAHRDALDPAALDRDRLVPAADDAHVGIARPELRGRVEGAVSQVSHRGAAGSVAQRAAGGAARYTPRLVKGLFVTSRGRRARARPWWLGGSRRS